MANVRTWPFQSRSDRQPVALAGHFQLTGAASGDLTATDQGQAFGIKSVTYLTATKTLKVELNDNWNKVLTAFVKMGSTSIAFGVGTSPVDFAFKTDVVNTVGTDPYLEWFVFNVDDGAATANADLGTIVWDIHLYVLMSNTSERVV
jgi:hypothetical protein